VYHKELVPFTFHNHPHFGRAGEKRGGEDGSSLFTSWYPKHQRVSSINPQNVVMLGEKSGSFE